MPVRKFFLKSYLILLLIAGGLVITTGSCKSSNIDSAGETQEPLAKELEALIPKVMKDAKVPGVSIAIVRDGKLSWAKGFGVRDVETGAPVDENTRFEAVSVSKTVFAYAVMKLVEKGIISLDTPLVKYTKKRFLENDPRLDLITARHVLSHQSGFQNWRLPEDPLKIHFTPGSDFMYSGEGYFYLQSIITELTGKVDTTACGNYEAGVKVCATDFGEYLTKNVLLPNRMDSSGYVWNATIGINEARAHDTSGKALTKGKQSATDIARYGSAGGLLTSAKDYAQFIIAMLNPMENDSFRLCKQSVMTMVTPQAKLKRARRSMAPAPGRLAGRCRSDPPVISFSIPAAKADSVR